MSSHINVNDQIREAINANKPIDSWSKHFDAGRPVYYSESDTPKGLLVKQFPDGSRQLVRFHRQGDEIVSKL